jgi:hypothetical protein
MALHGLSGSGKTFSSLAIATGLGSRIAVIDSEHGSSEKFADEFTFDVLPLAQFDPRNYIDAIHAAEAEGYDVVIIDSLSHEWIGPGGTLEIVDKVTARSNSKNAYTTGWREATPLHNALIDSIVRCKCHLIATMRVKSDYVMTTNNRGGSEPVKMGLTPVQRENMEYEFDIVGRITIEHKLIVEKTRYRAIDGEIIDRPGKAFGAQLLGWLSDGKPIPESGPIAGILDAETAGKLRSLLGQIGATPVQVSDMLARRGVTRIEDLTGGDADEIIGKLTARVAANVSGNGAANAPAAVPATPESYVVPSVPDPEFVAKVAQAEQLPGITKPANNGGTVDYTANVPPASHDGVNGLGDGNPDPADDFRMADATRPDRNGNAAQVVTA